MQGLDSTRADRSEVQTQASGCVLNAIALVKNEDDVIRESLEHAASFCDMVYVMDNGSTDETWHITQALAQESANIVAVEQTTEPYTNGLRAKVYNLYNRALTANDWWLILDADEFLEEDPRGVIAQAQAENADFIDAWHAQFYYTKKDHAMWPQEQDRKDAGIRELRRYYRVNWKSRRLFRNNPHESWDQSLPSSYPPGLKKRYSGYVMNGHYQYRSPVQIKKRLETRVGVVKSSFGRRYGGSTDVEPHIRDSRFLKYRAPGETVRFDFFGLSEFYYKQTRNRIRSRFRLGR